ncbi:MAG: cytidylate kinase family protein [Lachnospiraceae bacterium]|nr:cytidylate kinase family protein [Lachnospiraceae bacterium]
MSGRNRNKSELTKRYMLFLLGIFANAIGVALMTKSMLGTGPTACIPFVLSEAQDIVSFGFCTFIFNMLLLLIQILLLRTKFTKQMWLQVPMTFAFSVFLDGAMILLLFVNPHGYAQALLSLMIGCVFRSFGVACQVVADVAMLSTEAFIKAISDTFHFEFSIVKLSADAIMAAAAAIASYLLLGDVVGVREGTLIAVILVGPLSRSFADRLGFIRHYFVTEGDFYYRSKWKPVEGKRLVITVTSESGSGGRIIARILGQKFGIPVYDKELISMIAKEGDFSVDYVTKHNERLYSNPIEAFIMENYKLVSDDMEVYRDLYEAQKATIENLAYDHDCIIVGHCSHFILRDFESAFHVHVTADTEHRITYMENKYNVGFRKALDMIEHQDQDVDVYYRHFTNTDWKAAANYHLCLDSTMFGYEGVADIVEHAVRENYMDISKATVRDVIEKYHLENSK